MSSTDPYHVVEQEIQTTLHNARQLLASFVRMRNMSQRDDSEELVWSKNEINATLSTLETDLEDLDESVKIVESGNASSFGLASSEVSRRRRYVDSVRKELQNMRMDVSSPGVSTSNAIPLEPVSPTPRKASGYPSPFAGLDEPEDDQSAWARQEQQMMIREQDRTIDSIAGTLSTIAEQAGLMGQEIEVHNEMLGDLEQGVDETDNKLNASMLKMRKFIRQTEEKGSGWCIIILIIVLCMLLLAVILT